MNLLEARDAFLRWLEAKGYSPRTVTRHSFGVRALVAYLKDRGISDARDATRGDVDAFQSWTMKRFCWRGGRRLSRASVEKTLSPVKQFFDFLARREALVTNPAAHWERPAWRRDPLRNIPTEKELEAILARPDIGTHRGLRDRTMLEVFYSTGIRRNELVRLDLYDVNLGEGALTVRHGKGGKGRTLPLVGAAMDFLIRYMREVRPLMLGARWAGITPAARRESPLFIEPGGRRIKAWTVGQMVRRHVRAVNPAAPLSCHILRHAFATHMLRGGADIRLIQRMLGHAHVSSTEIYTTVQTEDLRAEHKRCHPRGGKVHEDQ